MVRQWQGERWVTKVPPFTVNPREAIFPLYTGRQPSSPPLLLLLLSFLLPSSFLLLYPGPAIPAQLLLALGTHKL